MKKVLGARCQVSVQIKSGAERFNVANSSIISTVVNHSENRLVEERDLPTPLPKGGRINCKHHLIKYSIIIAN
jgi:hypothetical protein